MDGADDRLPLSCEPVPVQPHRRKPIILKCVRMTGIDLLAACHSARGPVVLVGATGSGKTATLGMIAAIPTASGRTRYRWPGEPRPAVTLDLVDGVDADGLKALDAEPAFPGRRILAVRPEMLPGLRLTFPDALIVPMRPLDKDDVTAMLLSRCASLGLPADTFSFRAQSRLRDLCGGNPGRLDRLALGALHQARIGQAARVLTAHANAATEGDRWQPGPTIIPCPGHPRPPASATGRSDHAASIPAAPSDLSVATPAAGTTVGTTDGMTAGAALAPFMSVPFRIPGRSTHAAPQLSPETERRPAFLSTIQAPEMGPSPRLDGADTRSEIGEGAGMEPVSLDAWQYLLDAAGVAVPSKSAKASKPKRCRSLG